MHGIAVLPRFEASGHLHLAVVVSGSNLPWATITSEGRVIDTCVICRLDLDLDIAGEGRNASNARIFVDEELVCNLPAIDSTRPLKWSGLLRCDVFSTSAVALRLCKTSRDRPRYFNFPPFVISEADEETGEAILELPEAAWVVTIKLLTPAIVEQLFPDELEKLNAIEGTYDSLDPNATVKYLFKNALKIASLVAEALNECTAKVSFLIYIKAWELLDQQAHLDETIQAILRGLTCVGDIVDIADQASSSMLTTAMNRSKEPIYGILALLEDVSIYIFNQLATNDLAPVPLEEEDPNDPYDIEMYLARLKDLQAAFHALWSPRATSPTDPAYMDDNAPLDTLQQGAQSTINGSTRTIDPYEILHLLRPMDPSGYDPRQACLEGTRKVILTRIITWTQNRENTEGLMWISGQAGMGKTSVATSLCQRLDDIRALAGSFFCQRDSPDTSDPLRLINNLVHEIAMQCPAYALEVADAIRANRKLCNAHLGLRYDGLIKKPLERLQSQSTRAILVIVIDALDECGDCDSREQILHLLYEMSQLVSWLKIIITARPIGDIHDYFRNNCPRQPILHLQDYDASPDIRAYIEGQVTKLAETERWPPESISQLCNMSCGVFLWATLAIKYIKKSAFPALPRLRKVLSNQKSPVTDHFDTLYTRTLKTAIGDNEGEIKGAFLRCIGAILAISECETLALPDLEYLLLVAGRIDKLTLEETIKNLSPLLLVMDGRRIRFHHPSFKDFVADSSRSWEFNTPPNQYEAEPAACCLKVMQRDLRFNICELETSHRLNNEVPDLKHRIDSNIGPALKYACNHWVDHFIASPTQALVEAIKEFLEGPQLMYWIEALSLLGRIDLAIVGLSKLTALELTRFDGWSLIVSWAKDAHRFLLSFYDAITASTPHLYVSALAFAPRKSLTALRMRPYFPNTITIARGGDSYWHPCMRTTVHAHAVQSLSISPDGGRVITGYLDGSLAIWDKQTGACISKSLISHRDVVTCAVFSPNGKTVASSSQDTTIRVWVVAGGLQDSRVLTGHSGPVHSVAFAPNTPLIASGSSDRTIRLWSPDNTYPICGPYVEHSSRVSSVAFSPDGTKLVSGSWDKTIRVWSVDLGSLRLANNPLLITGHSHPVTCVLFSPDGSKIASGSVDKTIQIWDTQTGTKSESHTLPAKHSDTITSIAFSPDGKYIASCSLDGAIHLCGAKTSTYSQPFGHFSPVNAIAFSPDGSHVVSGSTDMTTRVWEINACSKPMAMGPLVGHTSNICSIAVACDATCIVSGSNDNTMRIWDAQTGAPVCDPLIGHSSGVWCVAISPDGARIVSVSHDKTMKLWDMATNANIKSYEHNSAIDCTAFSPSGALIAFGSHDNKVYLWDLTGWKMIKEGLQGHSRKVLSVAFSPDGTCVASASADKTVILWDIRTHSNLGMPLSGHTDYVRSVAFSPCGTQLVSGSDDHTVRLWDRHRNTTIHTLTGHSNLVMAVAFSPDGSCIGSGSCDHTVCLWNAKTGQIIGQTFTGHSDDVNCIVFSPDGNYLISSSDDQTICVWSIALSYPVVEPENELPDTFCWPANPYKMSSHPKHPGWVTHDHQSLVFWLPTHYEQHEQFLGTSQWAPCPLIFLDYSKFVHGTAWTGIAFDSMQNCSR